MSKSTQCISCNQLIPENATSCKCGHVNEAMRTIGGKRFSGYREELYTRLVIQESRDEYEKQQRQSRENLKRVHEDTLTVQSLKETPAIEPPKKIISQKLNQETNGDQLREITKVLNTPRDAKKVVKTTAGETKRDTASAENTRAVRSTRNVVINFSESDDDNDLDDDDDDIDDDEYHPGYSAGLKKRLKAAHKQRGYTKAFAKRGTKPMKEVNSNKYNVYGHGRSSKPRAHGRESDFMKGKHANALGIENSDSEALMTLPKNVPMTGPLAEINKRMVNQSIFWMCLTNGLKKPDI
ncbi:nucleophosmin isoform X2 [Nematostella vectensis]|uniref:nucleophosmin isoform X2 n=1 Tax=Nematostella vectensis TaxID=45351 RepID=UPI0020774940|nr:nucleophosmin isoform X2 [Nematostella vectensis]